MQEAAGLGVDGKEGLRLPTSLVSLGEEIVVIFYMEERSPWPSLAPGASCMLTSLIFLMCNTSSERVWLLNPLPVMNIS